MSSLSRRLPERQNALLVESVPDHEELISRRRLGQTQLSSRIAVSPSSGASSPSNGSSGAITAFDYAHLRAPLPKGIVSGIFKPSPNSYFLMRRSSDGYVSATGMFRATFPYSEVEEEEEERKHIKSLPTTSPEETAGNIWVPPEDALALANDYGILPWIRALLDVADIPVSGPPAADGSPSKKIAPPPKFVSLAQAPTLAPPTPTPAAAPRSSRARRSASPTKAATAAISKRVIASPRKRTSKAAAAAAAAASQTSEASVASTESTPAPSAVGQSNSDAVLPSVEEETKEVKEAKTKKHSKKKSDVTMTAAPPISVSIAETKVFAAGNDEILLAGKPPSPEESARLLAEAKEMVRAATNDVTPAASTASAATSKKGKRKAEEDIKPEGEDKENAGAGEGADQPRAAKKVKTEVQIRKERVRNRALLGLSATLAVGAIVPYVMGML
ncbi:transcription factor [Ophiostoma piceae UAMH 11346]|uniref:Transcription factor n=1 Tax=Ophiostoma piceae (strain UAMH 11346) TaxID=1262450 RepID=S3BSM1_OPHP1|nr:transcription factor [Ophiostoma piceae UAMH 11346]